MVAMIRDEDVTFYPWYCGRFSACAEMLAQPDVYTREDVLRQLAQVQAEFKREQEARRMAAEREFERLKKWNEEMRRQLQDYEDGPHP